ncbi:MAG: 3-dehydroquinate synthase [Flavipsychrobacter sp.]|nr:3-dehydroquinate synthase [Flavipsychrobacter sp.]
MQQSVTFPSGTVKYIFQSSCEEFLQTCDKQHTVLLTNEHLAGLYPGLFKDFKTIVIPAGETSKSLDTINRLTKELLLMEATRKTTLIGVGGGVITDITGFLASVYMRGISFGFIPTTLLGMVDAAIGGKNGVNAGLNKNIIGTIAQPQFILFDTHFLETLPDDEWSNGFAEIIKYACIFDADMFAKLSRNSISYYQDDRGEALKALIEKCVAWKNKTVLEDEKENGVRKLLNFGHTAAHAIENMYELPHGKAVGIGMVIACMLSEEVAGMDQKVQADLKKLLSKYHLPARFNINAAKAMEILKMDKKRIDDTIDYILLEKVGTAVVRSLPFAVIENVLTQYESDN